MIAGTSLAIAEGMRLLLVLALVGACHTHSLPDGPCSAQGSGTLPGVTLTITSDSCVYDQGTPAKFTYVVTTDASVPAIAIPDSGASSCGSCDQPGIDVLSWVVWTIGGTGDDGTAESYCLCDTGCCPPWTARTVQPAIGTASDVIDWSGHTWTGPSDYGNPQGDAFAPGIYGVHVTFRGFDHGSVQAVLPIEID